MFTSNKGFEELVLRRLKATPLIELFLTFGFIPLYSPVVNCHAQYHGGALQVIWAVIRFSALLFCQLTVGFERLKIHF